MPQSTEFTIPKTGHLVFDALTFKQFIKDRLNETNVFTDQNYEGSYITTINEIIAYTFNALLFYLNKTSTESMFSEAQLYENMNRIVKLLDYKPIGKQTSTLSFSVTADSALPAGLYNIPRYSYIENGQKTYSFNEDIVFAKTTALGVSEPLTSISDAKLLYQGQFKEYPVYNAVGNDNELVFFNPGVNVLVDHFNIDVYVKYGGVWSKWNKVPSLYLESAGNKSFEIRLNENKVYELKFGNNINGIRLDEDDQVAIFYLESTGSAGEVGVNAIRTRGLIPYSSNLLNEITTDINNQVNTSAITITTSIAGLLQFDNTNVSTYYQAEETTDDIRSNAPGVYRSQYRLVTEADFETYIKTNFATFLQDIKVVNNSRYTLEQLKYYYDIGLQNPNDVSSVLYSQVRFADACNFNNVYAIAVPKTIPTTRNQLINMTPAQKELIITSLKPVKVLTSEVVLLDPVYTAVDICISGTSTATTTDAQQTRLVMVKDSTSRRDDNSIIVDVTNIFTEYFSRTNVKLGSELDITYLTNQLLSIQGISSFYTQRIDTPTIKYTGLSLLVWNPVYLTDTTLTTKNIQLPYFKYMYLFDRDVFQNKVTVESSFKVYDTIEY